ncbi:uncharacterized protein [Clytia hemisphaerica]|uniref:uncharacterized protein n=1 Tax=Clytia hemisphaerica TaxID=252671 RepID=UPI0034D3E786
MSKRNLPRINYKELHNTGRSIHVADHLSSQLANLSLRETIMPSSNESTINKIKVLIAAINDAIDETPINGLTATEVDPTISQMNSRRDELRLLCIESNLDDQDDLILSALRAETSIKTYNISARDHKSKLNLANTQVTSQTTISNEKSIAFSIEVMQQNLFEINSTITQDLQKLDDKQLTQLKDESSKLSDNLDRLSIKYEITNHR